MQIVFDIDDILWNLNEKACKIANIDINKLVHFTAELNPLLSNDERVRLLQTYSNLALFKNIKWSNGVTRINDLDADVHICSNIFDTRIDAIKRQQLHNILAIPDENIHLNLVTDCTKKDIPIGTDIFVDDSPYNIAQSTARVNIMLKKPWNTSIYGKEILQDKNVKMFDTLDEILDYIETIIQHKI